MHCLKNTCVNYSELTYQVLLGKSSLVAELSYQTIDHSLLISPLLSCQEQGGTSNGGRSVKYRLRVMLALLKWSLATRRSAR